MGEDYGGHGPSHIRYFILSATSSNNSFYTFFAHSFLGNICVGLAPGHFDGGDHSSTKRRLMRKMTAMLTLQRRKSSCR